MRIYRIAAVLLLLLAGGEVLACEWSDMVCGPDEDATGHSCLCCCRHIVMVPPIVFAPAPCFEFPPPPGDAPQVTAAVHSIDHPPRA